MQRNRTTRDTESARRDATPLLPEGALPRQKPPREGNLSLECFRKDCKSKKFVESVKKDFTFLLKKSEVEIKKQEDFLHLTRSLK